MPFPSLDTAFREAIKDDVKIFDNKETLIIHHNSDDATVDWTSDEPMAQIAVVSTTVDDCLFRQPSSRNGSSVPMLHERAQAIQKDDFLKYDVVIEVPKIENLAIKERDTVERPKDGKKWRVVMVDVSTLATRFRLGCSIDV
jgi:hypothetical protein